MKKTIFTLTAFLGSALFATEGSVEELLSKVDQKFEDKNERYQSYYQQQKEGLEIGATILFNLGDYLKETVPVFIDKYMQLQDFAFEYAQTNPEIVENGALKLPEKPLEKEFLEKTFVVGMKFLFSDEHDYAALRSLTFEKVIKESILWDVDDDYDFDVVDQAEEAIDKMIEKRVKSIIRYSQDPLLSEFVYPEMEKMKESLEEWIADHFIQYDLNRITSLVLHDLEAQNPIEEKLISIKKDFEEHTQNFAKSQKLAMNAYLNNLLSK